MRRNQKKQIFFLAGSLEEEAFFNFRELFSEECGVAAAWNLPMAARCVYDALMLQEHRGEHSVGIISFDRSKFYKYRRLGSVREHFLDVDFSLDLPGDIAIGHNRYATKGNPYSIANIQPLFFDRTRYDALIISHNGSLVDYEETREQLIRKGALFQSTTDSELLGHIITNVPSKTLEEAVVKMTETIPASYSVIVATADKIIVLRDRYGVRPLSMGKIRKGYLIASENYTFDQYPDCEEVEDIKPAEMVIFDNKSNEITKIQYAEPEERFCIFEGIYFSDPRSRYNGYWHEDFRYELGRKIYEENPDITGDVVIPVLDSGKHAALGFSEASGIPYKEYFRRLYNPPRIQRRSFTSVTTEERIRTAYQKLHLRKEKIKGKRVIVMDDSIVRSTTTRVINQRLREAGAKEIINCISAPPITDTCPYGMDFQDRQELIAYNRSIEEIEELIASDKLIYLSLKGLEEVAQKTYRCGICSGCFGGHYATPRSETS